MSSVVDPLDLERAEQEVAQVVPHARRVLEALRTQRLRPTWARVVSRSPALVAIRVQSPDAVQRHLGLAPELLFLVADSHLQTAHTRDGVPSLARDPRTDPFLAFWCDPKEGLKDRLGKLTSGRQAWIAFTPGDNVEQLLHGHLSHYNSFSESGVVTGSELMGRERELAALRRDIGRRPAIGVFGLRRMGKTSLVTGLLDQVQKDEPEAWCTAYVDVQTHLAEGPDRVWRELILQLGGSGDSLAALSQRLRAALTEARRPLIVLDEYDWLFDRPEFARATVDLLGLIRGLQQSHRGAAHWIFVGRAPTLLNGPRVGAAPNPTLNYWHPTYVGPLERQEAGELLRKLGRRMALNVGRESKDEAFRLTRGHPHLTRLYGSHLAAAAPRAGRVDRNDPTDPVALEASRRFSRSPEAKNWVAEVEELLQKHHPDSFALLQALCEPGDPRPRWVEERDSEAADQLLAFGLVDAENGEPPGLLRDRRQPRAARQSAA